MQICNVTGSSDGELFEFYINQDFGHTAKHLQHDEFSFALCEDEFMKFMKKGKDLLSPYDNKEDYTQQHGKWFSSEEILDLISSFEIAPKGIFNVGWLQFTDEEEQVLWENQELSEKECVKVLFPKRFGEDRTNELMHVLGVK